jgi:hypothetical protein
VRLALLDRPTGLEGRSAQLYQLLLGTVVGRLQRLGSIGHAPQRGAQAWIPQARKFKKGSNPRREDQQNKATKRRLTFNLLPLPLESLASVLDRLLQADDRGALLLEGPELVRVRDAEGDQLPVELRDIGLPLLQRRLRPLESSTLSFERRPGINEGGPLLLELTLGLLVAACSCRSCSSAATTAATLAARAAFNSSASLAFCSASLALSSAWPRWDRASSSSARTYRF